MRSLVLVIDGNSVDAGILQALQIIVRLQRRMLDRLGAIFPLPVHARDDVEVRNNVEETTEPLYEFNVLAEVDLNALVPRAERAGVENGVHGHSAASRSGAAREAISRLQAATKLVLSLISPSMSC